MRWCVGVLGGAVASSLLPCAREESEHRARVHRKQRIAVTPPSVILPSSVPLIALLVTLTVLLLPVVVVVPRDERRARQRSVPLLAKRFASIHLPRAEREPSKLSPGRMLLHIQKTEGGQREREGEMERGGGGMER